MTVALYLNKPVPILISDCLVVQTSAEKQSFSPSNIEHFQLTLNDVFEEPKLVTITEMFRLPGGTKTNHSTYPAFQVEGLRLGRHESLIASFDLDVFGEWLRQELLNDPFIVALLGEGFTAHSGA